MSKALSVPSNAVPYILFQRTNYLRFGRSLAYRIINRAMPFNTFNSLVRLEARLWPERIAQAYSLDMLAELEVLRPVLPTECDFILDIGCGVAGIDALISHEYARAPRIALVDKSTVDAAVWYKFEGVSAFYNSLAVASDLLIANGIAKEKISTHEVASPPTLPKEDEADLIISLLSWGFHYPLEVYLDQAVNILRGGGRVIVDVRRNTNGLSLLESSFSEVSVIVQAERYLRVVAKSPRKA